VAAAGDSPLTRYANLLAQEHFPTFNNGLFGRAAGSVFQRMPGSAGDFGEFLGDASRATPFFTKVGVAGGVLGFGLGTYHTYQDFAQHKGFDDTAIDATGTAFSAVSVAFLVFPEVGVPVLAGAGLAWGAAEAWKHRDAIGHAVESTGKFLWDTSAPGLLWNNRDAIGSVLDDGADLASSGLHTAESGLSKVGHVVNPLNW